MFIKLVDNREWETVNNQLKYQFITSNSPSESNNTVLWHCISNSHCSTGIKTTGHNGVDKWNEWQKRKTKDIKETISRSITHLFNQLLSNDVTICQPNRNLPWGLSPELKWALLLLAWLRRKIICTLKNLHAVITFLVAAQTWAN